MIKPFSLSIILPVYNESQTIKRTLEESFHFLNQQAYIESYELIGVDDGSRDQSSDAMTAAAKGQQNFKLIRHSKNLGYGAALISGIKQAKFSWILLMDADGQIRIDSLNKMVGFLNEYDIISGYRQKRMDSFYRRLLGKAYTMSVRILLGVKSSDINCGFKMFRKEFLDVEGIRTHAGAFYTHVLMKAQRMNARIKEVPIRHFPRKKGTSTGANLKVVTTAMTDMVRLLFEKKNDRED